MDPILDEKYYRLRKHLEGLGSALVAYSGGVDSTLLLAVGREALGENIMAVTVSSPLHPRSLVENAQRMAARLGSSHIIVATDELQSESSRPTRPSAVTCASTNGSARLIDIAAREGIAEVIEGSQVDDLGDYRPGMEAARGAVSQQPAARDGILQGRGPGAVARAGARHLEHAREHLPRDADTLRREGHAGEARRSSTRASSTSSSLGLGQVRLRYVEDRTARIEVSQASIPVLTSDGIRETVVSRMKELGFIYVTGRPGRLPHGGAERGAAGCLKATFATEHA